MVDFVNQNNDFLMVIISTCSILMSGIAIFISIYTTITQNKFNRNSVKPFADIKTIILETKLTMELYNCGLGVMLIENIEYHNNREGFLKISDIFSFPCKTYAEWEYDDSSLAAGDKVKLLEVSFDKQTDMDKAVCALDDLVVVVNFYDMYNVKWNREFRLKKTCQVYSNARHIMGTNSIIISDSTNGKE